MRKWFIFLLLGILAPTINVNSANNQWDDSEETIKYLSPGAFTLDNDPTYTAWDTATNIWTVRTPDINNPDGANPRRLGGLRIRNQVDTVVTITNSFDGFVEVLFLDDGTYTNGSTIRFISLDEGVTVTGNQSDNNNDFNRDNARWGFRANGAEYQDTIIMEEGHYVGRNLNAGGIYDDLKELYIYGTRFTGGQQMSYLNDNGKDRNGQGAAGLQLGMSNTNGIHTIVISNRLVETDAIRGGDGAIRVRQNTANKNAFAYGGDGLQVDSPNNGSDVIDIQSLPAYGGNGGLVDYAKGGNNPVDVKGGTAVDINNMTVSIANGRFYGGDAGTVNSAVGASSVSAKGGLGLYIHGNSTINFLDNIIASGGDGGTVGNAVDSVSVNASGGVGSQIDATLNFSPLSNFTSVGGKGGTVKKATSTSVNVNGGIGFIYNPGAGKSVALDNVTILGGDAGSGSGNSTVTADGGYGINVDHYTLTLSNSIIMGGDGGVANGGEGSSAMGGDAIDAQTANLYVYNTTLSGGSGGTLNGIVEDDGYALNMFDSNLTVSNSAFYGKGLYSETRFRSKNGKVNIQTSDFNSAIFTGTGTHNINVSDSHFSAMELGGPSPIGKNTLSAVNSTVDNVVLSGRARNTLDFKSSAIRNISQIGLGTANIIMMDTNTTVSGMIYQDGGKLSINKWNESQIHNVQIDSGTMNFAPGDLTLDAGERILLGDKSSQANFKNHVTVERDAILDVGLGAFTAADLLVKSGAQLGTGIGNANNGVIRGNNITLEPDITWYLYGTSTQVSNRLLLASATVNLTSFVSLDDIITDTSDWMTSVKKVYTDNNNLYADYGAVKLVDVIPSTGEFGKALHELDTLMNSSIIGTLNNQFNSAQDAAPALFNTLVRTPEVANTMIDLQHSLAWQQYDRFNSFRRYNNWANRPAPLQPTGAHGPGRMFNSAQDWFDEHLPLKDWWNNAIEWANDRLPGKEVLESAQMAMENILPEADVIEMVQSTAENYDPLPKIAESAIIAMENTLPKVDIMEKINSTVEDVNPLPKIAESAKTTMENTLPKVDVLEKINTTVENIDPLPKIAESAKVSIENTLPEGDLLATVNSAMEEHDPLPKLTDAVSESLPKDQGFLTKFKGWISGKERTIIHTEEIELPKTYQVWGRAYGQTLSQDSETSYNGYHAHVGGANIGFDKSFDNLLIGVGGGFAQTTVRGDEYNDADATSGYASLYATASGEKTFLDFNLTYAINDIETESHPVFGYKGDFTANTLSCYVGGGIGFPMLNDHVLFTPEASLQSIYYDQESYTENSPLFPDKKWDSYDEWSFLSAVGFNLSSIHKLSCFDLEFEFQPEIRIHWLHEFNSEMDRPTYTLTGGTSEIRVSLQAREEDLLKIGAGIKFASWYSDAFEFSLDVDATLGNDYQAFLGSGRFIHRF